MCPLQKLLDYSLPHEGLFNRTYNLSSSATTSTTFTKPPLLSQRSWYERRVFNAALGSTVNVICAVAVQSSASDNELVSVCYRSKPGTYTSVNKTSQRQGHSTGVHAQCVQACSLRCPESGRGHRAPPRSLSVLLLTCVQEHRHHAPPAR